MFGPGPADVSQYTVGAGGMLTPDSTATVAAGYSPVAVAVSPNSRYVYVTDGSADGARGVLQYTVGAGGMLSPHSAATVAAGPAGVAVSPNGRYVYVANEHSAGGLGVVSQYTIGAGGMLHPDSPPYVNAGDSAFAVAVSPNGRYVYVTNQAMFGKGPGDVSQYTIGAGGMLTPGPTVAFKPGDSPYAIAIAP
jgi:DNA-binding beta-propeller fold protein YncE